jgi:hypothetical protein
MSQLSAIAYTSTSVHPMSRVDIEALLFKCRAFNSDVGVTGTPPCQMIEHFSVSSPAAQGRGGAQNRE